MRHRTLWQPLVDIMTSCSQLTLSVRWCKSLAAQEIGKDKVKSICSLETSATKKMLRHHVGYQGNKVKCNWIHLNLPCLKGLIVATFVIFISFNKTILLQKSKNVRHWRLFCIIWCLRMLKKKKSYEVVTLFALLKRV